MKYWLMKTEPDVFSIDDLKNASSQKTPWEGVRNYQARNFMMKEMSIGDQVLIYHSNASPPGVAGVGKVVSSPYPDPSAFDPKSEYFDEKSSKEKPRWFLVDIGFVSKLNYVTLETLKKEKKLQNMLILRKGNRLSITPVTKTEFGVICQLGGITNCF